MCSLKEDLKKQKIQDTILINELYEFNCLAPVEETSYLILKAKKRMETHRTLTFELRVQLKRAGEPHPRPRFTRHKLNYSTSYEDYRDSYE